MCCYLIPDPLDSILAEFKEALEEKKMLAKLLHRTQQVYEGRELLRHRYLSQKDIEKLVFERNPFKDSAAATVGAKYFHAVCGLKLRSFNQPFSSRLILNASSPGVE